MASLALGVRFNATSTGAGSFVDASAVTGYRRGVGILTDGATYRYRAENAALSEWEWGTGTWTNSSGTLTRTVTASSNANAAVSFTSVPQVAITIEPGDILNPGTDKAAASDVLTGTDNAKFVTSKAIADSHAPLMLTDGATINWNMASGYNAKVTLGGNRTLATPTNPILGRTYTLEPIQDGTGSRTLTFPASTIFDFGGAGAPTLSTTAGKSDFLTLFCKDASTPTFKVGFIKGT